MMQGMLVDEQIYQFGDEVGNVGRSGDGFGSIGTKGTGKYNTDTMKHIYHGEINKCGNWISSL